MRRISSGLTYANVMATIAVFVALGGTAFAAVTITGRDVQDGSLSGRDIKQGTLQSGDIKDGTLRRQDFFPGVLPGGLTGPLGQADGLAGPAGPGGAAGPAGVQGERGPAGPAGAAGKDGIDGVDGQDGADGTPGAAGQKGADGINGTNGAPGTAVAYGTLSGPTVFDAKNITNANVTYPTQGVYCVKGLTVGFKSAIATPTGPGYISNATYEWDKVANIYTEPNGFPAGTSSLCPAGTQVMVTLYDIGAAIIDGTGRPGGFASGSVTIWLED
jgi:hypothetical protein